MSGYLSREYAESFTEFGLPVLLPYSRGHVLRRRIPGTPYSDVTGLYPLFCCEDWCKIGHDFDTLDPELVSLCLVADPFGNHSPALFAETFDVVLPFKARYIVSLSQPPEAFVSTHHRKYAYRALDRLRIEHCPVPSQHLDDWIALYAEICRRRRIRDLRAFSPEAFRCQLQTPGLVMFRAQHEGRTVAIHLWISHRHVAYAHLAGHAPEAYRLHASYALYWQALQWFYGRVEFLDLGGTAGAEEETDHGLAFFKKGWATEVRPGYLCGRVLRTDLYASLVQGRAVESARHFPAYRAPAGADAGRQPLYVP